MSIVACSSLMNRSVYGSADSVPRLRHASLYQSDIFFSARSQHEEDQSRQGRKSSLWSKLLGFLGLAGLVALMLALHSDSKKSADSADREHPNEKTKEEQIAEAVQDRVSPRSSGKGVNGAAKRQAA